MNQRFCVKCGSPLDESMQFCRQCGQPVQPTAVYPPPYAPQPMYVVPQTSPGRGFGIASMVLGIASLVIYPFTLILAVLAIVFAQVARNKGYVCGISTTGLVTGIVSLALIAVGIIIAIAFMSSFVSLLSSFT